MFVRIDVYLAFPNVTDALSLKVLVGEQHGVFPADLSLQRLQPTAYTPNLTVYSVDYHYANHYIFLVGYNENIYRIFKNWTSEIIVRNVSDSARIAVDWVHDRIYWMSDHSQAVEVAHLDGSNRTPLIKDLSFEYPNNIVVDPYMRYLFFVSKDKVFKSQLDGSNPQELNLADTNNSTVTCLALDRHNSKLYQAGRRGNDTPYLASSSYDGSDLHYFDMDTSWDIFSIDVLWDKLFFATYQEGQLDTLRVMDLSNGTFTDSSKKIYVPRTNDSVIFGIRIYHPDVQLQEDDSTCRKPEVVPSVEYYNEDYLD